MSNAETRTGSSGGLLPRHGASAGPGGQSQVDIGNYEIFAGPDKVGEVWVDVDPSQPNNQAYTIEYWCLYSNYVAPSRAAPNVDLRFQYVTGLHASLRDFQTYALSVKGSRYIVSKCQDETR